EDFRVCVAVACGYTKKAPQSECLQNCAASRVDPADHVDHFEHVTWPDSELRVRGRNGEAHESTVIAVIQPFESRARKRWRRCGLGGKGAVGGVRGRRQVAVNLKGGLVGHRPALPRILR